MREPNNERIRRGPLILCFAILALALWRLVSWAGSCSSEGFVAWQDQPAVVEDDVSRLIAHIPRALVHGHAVICAYKHLNSAVEFASPRLTTCFVTSRLIR